MSATGGEVLGWVVVEGRTKRSPEHLPFHIVSPIMTKVAAERERDRIASGHLLGSTFTVEPVGTPPTSDTSRELRRALDAYEADPIDARDRPSSWGKLAALLAICRALALHGAADAPGAGDARTSEGEESEGPTAAFEEGGGQ